MIIGTGVDITEVRRIRQAAEKWGKSFLGRVFTDKELEYAHRHGSFYQHLAGRFAAKEAVFKALGDPKLTWKDLEIVNDAQGKPHCAILKAMKKQVEVLISISHVKSYATAFAIITPKTRCA